MQPPPNALGAFMPACVHAGLCFLLPLNPGYTASRGYLRRISARCWLCSCRCHQHAARLPLSLARLFETWTATGPRQRCAIWQLHCPDTFRTRRRAPQRIWPRSSTLRHYGPVQGGNAEPANRLSKRRTLVRCLALHQLMCCCTRCRIFPHPRGVCWRTQHHAA